MLKCPFDSWLGLWVLGFAFACFPLFLEAQLREISAPSDDLRSATHAYRLKWMWSCQVAGC